jgi:hypothetical protein
MTPIDGAAEAAQFRCDFWRSRRRQQWVTVSAIPPRIVFASSAVTDSLLGARHS